MSGTLADFGVWANGSCTKCGHQRIFHEIGTGNGVPVGKAYCDDRHASPCSCTGFTSTPPGYHLTEIQRGEIGELSKIQEELDELKDATKQGVKIMQLVELSDLVGSINLYLAKYHPAIRLGDLEAMADVTARAFHNGHRKPR